MTVSTVQQLFGTDKKDDADTGREITDPVQKIRDMAADSRDGTRRVVTYKMLDALYRLPEEDRRDVAEAVGPALLGVYERIEALDPLVRASVIIQIRKNAEQNTAFTGEIRTDNGFLVRLDSGMTAKQADTAAEEAAVASGDTVKGKIDRLEEWVTAEYDPEETPPLSEEEWSVLRDDAVAKAREDLEAYGFQGGGLEVLDDGTRRLGAYSVFYAVDRKDFNFGLHRYFVNGQGGGGSAFAYEVRNVDQEVVMSLRGANGVPADSPLFDMLA
ncbi:hypothetical protein C882_2760 [Caenispirillum salinarum AK4]|uniref:Uncharacterized protein n=2 Tax=Caenispirillum TaxID=414051 RepID=K9H768_9PROT|nr:hypothetical protein C882_2760 [Caenispirillum salinarum AK4]